MGKHSHVLSINPSALQDELEAEAWPGAALSIFSPSWHTQHILEHPLSPGWALQQSELKKDNEENGNPNGCLLQEFHLLLSQQPGPLTWQGHCSYSCFLCRIPAF